MFRKKEIPATVIAFARKQSFQIVTDPEKTSEAEKKEFYLNCEEINHAVTKEFPEALPMNLSQVEQNKDDDIILIRVVQYKNRQHFVNGAQIFVRVKTWFGYKWYQVTADKMMTSMQDKFRYEVKSDRITKTIDSCDLRFKDFCYKL